MAKVCEQTGKQVYPSQHKAIKAALSYSRKRGTPLRVYPCNGHFHLTKRRRFGATLDNIGGAA